MSDGTKVFYCPASSCHYNEGQTPFLRADNAKRHIKRMHPELAMEIVTRTHTDNLQHNKDDNTSQRQQTTKKQQIRKKL
jgi:hypothetical protein